MFGLNISFTEHQELANWTLHHVCNFGFGTEATVCVVGFPQSSNQEWFEKLFSVCGRIVKIVISSSKIVGKFRALVQFSNEFEAAEAVRIVHKFYDPKISTPLFVSLLRDSLLPENYYNWKTRLIYYPPLNWGNDLSSEYQTLDATVIGGDNDGRLKPIRIPFRWRDKHPNPSLADIQSWTWQFNSTIFVANLPNGIEEKSLRHVFSKFGPICSVQLCTNTSFLLFYRKMDAAEAILRMDGQRWGEWAIECEWWEPKRPGRSYQAKVAKMLKNSKYRERLRRNDNRQGGSCATAKAKVEDDDDDIIVIDDSDEEEEQGKKQRQQNAEKIFPQRMPSVEIVEIAGDHELAEQVVLDPPPMAPVYILPPPPQPPPPAGQQNSSSSNDWPEMGLSISAAASDQILSDRSVEMRSNPITKSTSDQRVRSRSSSRSSSSLSDQQHEETERSRNYYYSPSSDPFGHCSSSSNDNRRRREEMNRDRGEVYLPRTDQWVRSLPQSGIVDSEDQLSLGVLDSQNFEEPSPAAKLADHFEQFKGKLSPLERIDILLELINRK